MRFLKRKIEDERSKFKRYCSCGHSIVFTPTAKNNKTICSWCGHWIYKNNYEEFKDKLLKKKKEVEKELNNG